MRIQRHLCGFIGLIMLVAGGLICYRNPQQISFFAAAAVRAGLLLMVVWLAFPQLLKVVNVAPQSIVWAVVGLAAVLVVRPRLSRIAAVVALLLVVYSILVAWLRSFADRK